MHTHTLCCTDCHILEVNRYPIILSFRQLIFQSDTEYYKYTIKLTKLYNAVKINKIITNIWFNFIEKAIKLFDVIKLILQS